MATFGQYTEYDEFLEMLADAQRFKLKLNAHKGFLGDLSAATLLAKLREEVAELEEAASRGSAFDMMLEAADIANFALGFVIAIRQRRKQDVGTRATGIEFCSALGGAEARKIPVGS